MSGYPYEHVAVVATIDPDAYGTGTQTSDWVDMADFTAIQAILMAGAVVSSGEITFSLEQATSSTGANAKAISGKALSTTFSTSNDDEQAIICLRGDEMDSTSSTQFRYARCKAVLATAGADMAAVILGHQPTYGAPTDLSSVDSIVT
jgi:hypothetical protein